MSLISRLQEAAQEAREAAKDLPEIKQIMAEKEARESLEARMKEMEKEHEVVIAKEKENMAQVRTAMDGQISSLQREVDRLSSKLEKSSKLQKRLDEEHELRLQAEANLRVMEVPRETPDLTRLENLMVNMTRQNPGSPKRGTWNFEIVRDGDGHISRLVARPT